MQCDVRVANYTTKEIIQENLTLQGFSLPLNWTIKTHKKNRTKR